MEAGGLLPRALVPASAAPSMQPPGQQGALQPMGELLPPKRQAVVDRLRRRIESYRRRQTECIPRFDQSFSGVCEQQNVETSLLQKRFLEGKAKRQAKKSERKQTDATTISGNLHSSVHVQQKFGGSGDYSPPPKMQRGCGMGGGGGGGGGMPRNDGLTKFSVEIVQQLEFTTSAASSQAQQISTNVTVKALTNASVKNDCGTPPPSSQVPGAAPGTGATLAAPLECKRELPDDDFADLEQCAAALDKDAAAADFPGLGDLIGEDDRDEIIDSDAFDDLISEISEYPEFMKDFDLDGKGAQLGEFTLKVEDSKETIAINGPATLAGQGAFGARLPPYGAVSAGGDLSPAAHTLKQMAEQHQHKAGLGGAGDWSAGAARGGPQGGASRLYGGPYAPRPPPLHQQHQQLPHHLHMSQAQQMHISQPHHQIQVSAGQQMQLSGELKPGGQISMAAQQGMYFSHGQLNVQQNQNNQHTQQQHNQHHPHQQQNMSSPQHQQGVGEPTYTMSQSQTINFTQQTLRQRHPQSAPQGMHQTGPGPTAQQGGGVMTGMTTANANATHLNTTGAVREHQAKMLQHQQQQMLRAQQMQNAVRPPPPEYKTATHMMQHARATGVGIVNGVNTAAVRAGVPRPQQWRGNLLPTAPSLTPNYHQQTAFQQRFQQQRLQQHLLQHHHRAQQQIPQQNMMSHLVMQQNQVVNVQGQVPNIHLSQNQSMSMQQQQHPGMMMPTSNGINANAGQASAQPALSAAGPGPPVSFPLFPSQAADFNLDFLDTIPNADSNNFSAQDLLNSLDNVPGFNINDIL